MDLAGKGRVEVTANEGSHGATQGGSVKWLPVEVGAEMKLEVAHSFGPHCACEWCGVG